MHSVYLCELTAIIVVELHVYALVQPQERSPSNFSVRINVKTTLVSTRARRGLNLHSLAPKIGQWRWSTSYECFLPKLTMPFTGTSCVLHLQVELPYDITGSQTLPLSSSSMPVWKAGAIHEFDRKQFDAGKNWEISTFRVPNRALSPNTSLYRANEWRTVYMCTEDNKNLCSWLRSNSEISEQNEHGSGLGERKKKEKKMRGKILWRAWPIKKCRQPTMYPPSLSSSGAPPTANNWSIYLTRNR